MTAETFSDVLGLASGIVLLLTAFRNDGLGAFVVRLRESIDQARQTPGGADKKAEAVEQALKQELTTWQRFDRYALHWGAGLLMLSFLFKVGPKALVAIGWMATPPGAG